MTYCTRKPGVANRVDIVCPDCGHWLPTHIGCEHCPVCEMVALNKQLAATVEGGPDGTLRRALRRAGNSEALAAIASGPYRRRT
jgi:uncharacterized Zn finger protein (UPF0148 family)